MTAPGDKLLDDFGRPLVGNGGHPHPGDPFQPLGEQVLRRGDAELRIVDLAGMLLGVGDQLGKRVDRQRVGRRDRVAVARDQRDAHQVLELVVKTLVEQRVDRIEIGADEQVVAVARARHHVVRGERRAGAGLVIDDDRVPERRAQAIGDEARRNVGRPAGREADHHADRAGRIVLRRGAGGR